MKKKRVIALSMSVMLVASMVGCGSTPQAENGQAEAGTEVTAGADSSQAETEANQQLSTGSVPTYHEVVLGETGTDITTTIKFIHHKTDRDATSGGDGKIQEYIAAFNQDYPNITVETEAVTTYAEDALLRLSTGEWGDIMFIPAVEKKDLQTYFQPMGTVEELSQDVNFVNNWLYDDIAYGVSYTGNAQGVVYNKRIFEEAGITELPKTADEFVEDLKLIHDNTDAIPLYTNYAAGWTMGAWDAYIGIVSDGDDTFFNQKFVHTANPFENHGDGTGVYGLYNILYQAVEQGLTEDDYSTTDWEGCKGMINRGEIGCMVLGSWAFAQMVEAGDQGADIGYMPFPISVNGKQYVNAAGDYNYGINVNASDDNKTASMIFVKWMTEKSGWGFDEGGFTVAKDGVNPDMYSSFDGCEILSEQVALPGEEDYLNEMNAETELNFNKDGNLKVQQIIEHASNKDMTFDEIMEEWTKKWNDAQQECEMEVFY